MATTRYDELVRKILDWSNRDIDVFGETLQTEFSAANSGRLGDFIRYAADKSYRKLRIPPMERTSTLTFTSAIDEDGVEQQANIAGNYLPVPQDLIEFIHIRAVDVFGTGNSIVYNNKADTRTFHDFVAEKYDPRYSWTRQSNRILLPTIPGVEPDFMYEIFYYGRFAQPGTNYEEGPEVRNWFVDENERILLYGALGEAFTYLGEDDMAGKYLQLWSTEIDELNQEEATRHASGGNVQMNFDGRGMI